ncbi:hypothetical protein Tco_1149043, partial [Tanacetum coccineum]
HRAIPDFLTWRHSCSCVLNDLPTNGYDRNDVERLCAHLICLRDMREEVLVRSRLSYVWFSKECDPVFRRIDDNSEMSIYDFMTLPSWGDAKVVEESHHLTSSLLEHVPLHTTAPAAEGFAQLRKRNLRKRASEPGSSTPELGQTEGVDEADLTDFCAEVENSLERNEGISTRAVSAPTLRLGKRLGAPPSMVVISAFGPSHVGTLFPASTSGRSFSLGGVVVNGHVRKSEAEVVRRQIGPLHMFPLAPGPYHMPYPYEGVSSPLYTKEEWGGPHAPESNILCKDIFKDPDVCRKALDKTITPAELKRTESLLPLELSNRVNVLSALLVSHGLLHLEVTSLDDKLEKLKGYYDALSQENRELCYQRDATSEDVKKLQSQLTDAKAASAVLTEELTCNAPTQKGRSITNMV